MKRSGACRSCLPPFDMVVTAGVALAYTTPEYP